MTARVTARSSGGSPIPHSWPGADVPRTNRARQLRGYSMHLGFISRAPRIAAVALSGVALLTSALPVAAVTPGVTPPSVTASLDQSGTTTVTKKVQTTAIPPLVDIFLLEDETGSFGDDIHALQTLAAPGGSLITTLDNATGVSYAT